MNVTGLDCLHNPGVWATFAAWLIAQGTKVLCIVQRTHRLDFNDVIKMGGMPSAHSSAVTGLATSIGLSCGFDSPTFAVSLALAVVVMFDAQTVRRSAGIQARLLNQIVEQVRTEHKFPDEKLVELFGHTRLEVFMGALMGIPTALLVHAIACSHASP